MPFLIHPSVENRLITAAQALSENPDYARIVIGVAVFDSQASALIVKRAAHEEFLPNVWELPGGHVEDEDATILHAIVRETREETGLEVAEVVGEFESFVYTVERQSSTGTQIAKKTLQLNFGVRVSVADGDSVDRLVKLSPEEHQSHAWATLSSLETFGMTEGMLKVVADALVWGKEHVDERIGTMARTVEC